MVDSVIWKVINEGFCSFKYKLQTDYFCRNEYNVTGLCSRTSCPLANSRYATILEKDGICYLYMKTAERAHTPSNLWERVKLKADFTQALAQIDQHLLYWQPSQIYRCKQRLTKITQYLIRMRRLRLKVKKKLTPINKKIERREVTREAKAERIAMIDRAITKELLERLKQKVYDPIYNFSPHFDKLLQEEGEPDEMNEEDLDEEDYEDDYEDEEDEVEPEIETVEEDVFVEDEEDMEDYKLVKRDVSQMMDSILRRRAENDKPSTNKGGEEDDRMEDDQEDKEENEEKKPSKNIKKRQARTKTPPTKKRRGGRIEIEYEKEETTPARNVR